MFFRSVRLHLCSKRFLLKIFPLFLLTALIFVPSGSRSALAAEPPGTHLDGMTWHYFTHSYVDPEQEPSLQETCAGFGVGVVPTRINFCADEGGGVHHWEHYLSRSCDRPCTTCPKNTHPEYSCGTTTCSSGWWGDVSGCPLSSANLSISIFNDRDGDGVRGVDEDSVSATVRIYRSGAGQVDMFTGIGLDKTFADGDYRVKIEPLSGWIPTKWSVDHTPATTITTYKARAVWALLTA